MEEQEVEFERMALNGLLCLGLAAFALFCHVIYKSLLRRKIRMTVRRCPNPNCIRCQKYQSVQRNAKKRLPHLMSEWQRNNTGKNANVVFAKIIQGVVAGPPSLPTSNLALTFWEGPTTNVAGQYPTVLFIPRLTVQPIVTQMHQQACSLLAPSKSSLKLKEMLMEEYVNSQFNGGLWQNNDTGALDKKKNPNQLWEVLYLLNQGIWIKENTRSCSKTYSLVKQLHGLLENCIFGNVFFSVLYPGTKIEEHCGPTNVRHRLHFPLHVPSHKEDNKKRPTLGVLQEKINWIENEPFVFDDSLVHAAEYPDSSSSDVRVVLVIDLWHPNLTMEERNIICDLFPI